MKLNRRSTLGLAVASAVTSIFGFTSAASAASKNIVKLAKVKVGGTYSFQLPNGAPALLFRTKKGVFAYQRVCTHQGGLVAYFPPRKLLICPLHNSSFDPFKAGQVVSGPAITALPSVKVAVSGTWVVLA